MERCIKSPGEVKNVTDQRRVWLGQPGQPGPQRPIPLVGTLGVVEQRPNRIRFGLATIIITTVTIALTVSVGQLSPEGLGVHRRQGRPVAQVQRSPLRPRVQNVVRSMDRSTKLSPEGSSSAKMCSR